MWNGCRRYAAVVVLILIGGTALAGDRDHDGGFFLRLSAGAGTARTEFDDGMSRLEMSGTAGDINFAIGGIISRNLAIHATLLGWSLTDPDAEVNGMSGTVDGDVTLSGIGGGATYYFMPVNMYLSGSVGAATITVDTDDFDGETDTGFIYDLSVGKEWFVSNSWGLGVALGFIYHSIPEKDMDENWSGPAYSVRFSATLN